MIQESAIDIALNSLIGLCGVNVTIGQIETRGLFESNPVTIDTQTGLGVLSNSPRLTLKFDSANDELKTGTTVVIKGEKYRVRNVTSDRSKRKIYCELSKI